MQYTLLSNFDLSNRIMSDDLRHNNDQIEQKDDYSVDPIPVRRTYNPGFIIDGSSENTPENFINPSPIIIERKEEDIIFTENEDKDKIECEPLNDENLTINECLACSTNKPDYITVPCGHVTYCGDCIHNIINKRCPICRKDDIQYMRIFL